MHRTYAMVKTIKTCRYHLATWEIIKAIRICLDGLLSDCSNKRQETGHLYYARDE